MDTKQTNRQPRSSERPATRNKSGQRSPSRAGTPAARQRQRKAATEPNMEVRRQQKRPAQRRKPDREIVYVPGKPFNKKKLLFQIAVVAAVVLAVVFTLSLFFKVQVITVSGNNSYGISAIANASGIERGDNLLGINDAQISGRIITELPYIKNVRIGIKLPGTVNIEVEELDVVYAIADDSNQWWLITSEGRIVERTDVAGASGYTRIEGVTISGAKPGKDATAEEQTPSTTGEDGATQPVTITGADRLYTALTILQYLEQNDVLGEMTRVDVTNMASIKMQYGQRFNILLGDSSDLSYKIQYVVKAARQLEDYDKGTLDVSFADLDDIVYTPDGE